MSACVHHFVIEPVNGPVSRGVCCKCGLDRDHSNVPVEDAKWNNRPRKKVEQHGRRRLAPGNTRNVCANID